MIFKFQDNDPKGTVKFYFLIPVVDRLRAYFLLLSNIY
jgi:hypothetical protein